ncbi:MAG: PepSY domain-containing protein [Candidatus Aenigmarchaeota archaeon]|nr:PepSY domain-containing protein [Candidatus Aenigmarchaeota archaeon]
MKIKDLVNKIKNEKEIKDILKNGGFLVSILSILEPDESIKTWYIGFYDPSDKKITEAIVTDESLKIEEPDDPLREINNNLDMEYMKIDPDNAINIAKGELNKYKISTKKIIISFQKKEKYVWNVNFVGSLGHLITIDIDSVNGKILNSKEVNILRR